MIIGKKAKSLRERFITSSKIFSRGFEQEFKSENISLFFDGAKSPTDRRHQRSLLKRETPLERATKSEGLLLRSEDGNDATTKDDFFSLIFFFRRIWEVRDDYWRHS